MKKTKIICTIGPSTDTVERLEELVQNGMNVCRLNFSHGSHEEHKNRIDRIKEVRNKLDVPIAIMLDTKGPEIRLGKLSVEEVELNPGDILLLTTDDIVGDEKKVSVTYDNLPNDVKIGGIILIDDGLIELEVPPSRWP